MVDVSHAFVADRLWLLVAVATVSLTALAAVVGGVLGLPGAVVALLVTGIPIVGLLLLTPVLLLFGDVVADALVGPPDASDAPATTPQATEDPVETLKRRYADGELDEAELERRLERLFALDDVDAPDRAVESLLSEANGPPSAGGRTAGTGDEDNVLERE